MPGRKLFVLASAIFAPMVLLFGGCSSDDAPSAPKSIVRNLYIGGVCLYSPGGTPLTDGAYVWVREGSNTGPVVSTLTVTLNGHELQFQQSLGLYMGVAPAVVSGENVTFSVSDGLGAVSRTVQVPYAPSSIRLNGPSWNNSSSLAMNTLFWNNPVTTGQGLGVYIYDYDGTNGSLLYSGTTNDPHVTTLSLSNSDLAYYQTITSVAAAVYHVNYAEFPDNPGESFVVVASATWAVWPVTAAVSPAHPIQSGLSVPPLAAHLNDPQ